MNRKTFVIIAALFIAAGSEVTGAPGDSAASFLRIGVGAKPSSMGEAYAGVAGDPLTLYYNPAGLSGLYGYEFSFSHAFWFQGINYSNFVVTAPMFDGNAAIGVSALSVGNIEKVNRDGESLGDTYNPTDVAIKAAYAREVEEFSVGGALNLITSEIDGDRASAVAIDLGAMRYFGFLNAGISVQNLGTAMTYRNESDMLPLTVRLGASYPFYIHGIDILALAETSFSTEVPFKLNAGVNADYSINGITLSLRLGLKSYAKGLNALSHLTTGFGIFYDDVVLDYAFASLEDLGMTHRVSLGYRIY